MRRKIYLVCLGLILTILTLLFVLFGSDPSRVGASNYLELYDVKDELVGIVHCKTFYLRWHGSKTELEFVLYKRTRVAGHGVPGGVSGQWIQAGNRNILPVKDRDVCAVKDGDVFVFSIPIAYAYVRIYYDNKTMHLSGTTGEMTEIS